jgi:hypothetical protein
LEQLEAWKFRTTPTKVLRRHDPIPRVGVTSDRVQNHPVPKDEDSVLEEDADTSVVTETIPACEEGWGVDLHEVQAHLVESRHSVLSDHEAEQDAGVH